MASTVEIPQLGKHKKKCCQSRPRCRRCPARKKAHAELPAKSVRGVALGWAPSPRG